MHLYKTRNNIHRRKRGLKMAVYNRIGGVKSNFN